MSLDLDTLLAAEEKKLAPINCGPFIGLFHRTDTGFNSERSDQGLRRFYVLIGT